MDRTLERVPAHLDRDEHHSPSGLVVPLQAKVPDRLGRLLLRAHLQPLHLPLDQMHGAGRLRRCAVGCLMCSVTT
ncbi:hypothetical protein T261_7054 [Streptomyces lydicus]|nr:hypothetical protein T261_7054 [Streptomyces lydicus]